MLLLIISSGHLSLFFLGISTRDPLSETIFMVSLGLLLLAIAETVINRRNIFAINLILMLNYGLYFFLQSACKYSESFYNCIKKTVKSSEIHKNRFLHIDYQ